MKKNYSYILVAATMIFMSGCACIIPETIIPVYAPGTGGMTDSSIDQKCRIDVLKNVSSELYSFYKNSKKVKGETAFLRVMSSASADETSDYISRSFAKNGTKLNKYFERSKIVNENNILTAYPVIDGALNSEQPNKVGEERGCEVKLHARLTDSKTGNIIWSKDFTSKKFINLIDN